MKVGCVYVNDVLSQPELSAIKFPTSILTENDSPFNFLCSNPQVLNKFVF